MIEQLTETLGWHDQAYDVIAGTATAGIPWAAWVAAELRIPMVYVREVAKEHGQGRRVEGRIVTGQRVVVVEDLVTTGGSSLSTIDALIEVGAVVLACIAIFSYELHRAYAAFAQRGIKLLSLTGLSTLLEVAGIPAEQRETVRQAIVLALQG